MPSPLRPPLIGTAFAAQKVALGEGFRKHGLLDVGTLGRTHWQAHHQVDFTGQRRSGRQVWVSEFWPNLVLIPGRKNDP